MKSGNSVKISKGGHTGDVKNTPGGKSNQANLAASAVAGRDGNPGRTTDNSGKAKLPKGAKSY